MGGGGGDDGFSARQAELEARRQRARDALNVNFGVAPTGGAPTRAQFTVMVPAGVTPDSDIGAGGGGGTPLSEVFDEAGYLAAVREHQAAGGVAEQNKAARNALYDTVRTNAFTSGRRALDEKRGNAARDLKFALFAQGLNGGSVDLDQNATLGRTYQEGLLDLGAKADATRTGMMSNDEQTRVGLLQSIDAGMDQGSAISSALQQMRVNSERAASEAEGTNLGDLFADAGLLYTKSNAARGRQAGMDYFGQAYGGGRPPSSRTNNGIVTSTG